MAIFPDIRAFGELGSTPSFLVVDLSWARKQSPEDLRSQLDGFVPVLIDTMGYELGTSSRSTAWQEVMAKLEPIARIVRVWPSAVRDALTLELDLERAVTASDLDKPGWFRSDVAPENSRGLNRSQRRALKQGKKVREVDTVASLRNLMDTLPYHFGSLSERVRHRKVEDCLAPMQTHCQQVEVVQEFYNRFFRPARWLKLPATPEPNGAWYRFTQVHMAYGLELIRRNQVQLVGDKFINMTLDLDYVFFSALAGGFATEERLLRVMAQAVRADVFLL